MTMTPKDARMLGAALVEAGLLTHASPAPHGCKGLRRTHGTSAIDGHWAHSGRPCLIVCEHVALALVEARGWTLAAIRACRHSNDAPPPAAALRVVKRSRPKGCPCPAHKGGICEGAVPQRIAA